MYRARVLFSTGSLHLLDIAACFELAAEAGFDGMEIMTDGRWSTRDPIYLQKLSARHRLPVLVVHTPFSPALPGWHDPRDEIRRIEHTIRLAETVQAETIVVHLPQKLAPAFFQMPRRRIMLPWRSPFGPIKAWMEQGLLARLQQSIPIKIAVENMPARRIRGRLIDTTWWNTIEGWSRSHQWLTLDTTHWATKDVNPLDAYRAASERVCHVHLSNYDGHEHRLPHRGRLDLGALLRAMAADGFSGTISNELYPDSLEFHDDTALRRNMRDCLEFCRIHLSQ